MTAMLDFLLKMTNINIFFLLSTIFVLFSFVALLLVKRFVPHFIRHDDNPVIGNISAVIGVIYGVLTGLTALYLFNNNNAASEAVQNEANAVANIYRESKWLTDPTRTQIQKDIKLYAQGVIKDEWPLMNAGKEITHGGHALIEDISNQLKNYKITTLSEQLILADILQSIKNLYNAREKRVGMNVTSLSPSIWLVILIGTILTIAINYLFGMNFYLHLITVSATALMASAMIFLLVTLDRPFVGEFIIQSTPFESVLKFIDPPSNQVIKS